MYQLLDGIRVLDLTSVVLGPYATRFLGDFGADVIKVEAPGGDVFRTATAGRSPQMGPAFMHCNRNKRSMVLDLRNPRAATVLARLIEGADVLVHNMRAKSAGGLGLGYAAVRAINPDIVYCNACGFGEGGRYRQAPAYDDTLQAISGLADLNRGTDGAPRYLPSVVCDKVAGLHLALAVLAGLAARQASGKGLAIETPMFESMAAFLLAEHLAGRTFGPAAGEIGYARLLTANRKPFATRDGFVSIMPYTAAHWKRFFELLGMSDLAADERVSDPALRSQSLDVLYGIIAEISPTKTSAQWLQLLTHNDIPCAAVNRLQDLLDDPHLRDVGLFQDIRHPSEGPMVGLRSAFRVHGRTEQEDRPAPRLGEHGLEILLQQGFSRAEIADLISAGAVKLPGAAGSKGEA